MKRLNTAIELTNKCNFSCRICPHSKLKLHRRAQGMMSNAVFTRATTVCQAHAKSVVLGFFGEQLLHPNYVDFLMRLQKRSFKLVINTNMSVCTREIMDAWITARVDSARFSLDAISPDTFNVCRPGPVYDFDGNPVDKSLRLEVINEKIKYWLSLPKHRPTRLVYVKSSFNKADRKGFIAHWRPFLHRNDHLLLKQVLSYGGKIQNSLVQPYKCNIWDIGYLMIGWNGDVSPCNLDINLDLRLGNIMNSTLPKLYSGVVANKLRALTGCGKNLSPCKACRDGNNWSTNEIVKGK